MQTFFARFERLADFSDVALGKGQHAKPLGCPLVGDAHTGRQCLLVGRVEERPERPERPLRRHP